MITVIIPTYNRFELIKEIYEKSISLYDGKLFRFEIHDSSNNDDTEQYIKSLANKQIQYYRYDSNFGFDDKVILAIRQINTKYFYLCGDGVVLDFNLLEELLYSSYESYNIIDIESKERIGYLGQDAEKRPNIIYTYQSGQEYFAKYFSHLTFWGATIVNTSFFKTVMTTEFLQKYRLDSISWWFPCLLVEAFKASKNESILGTIYYTGVKTNKYKKTQSWTNGETYYKVVFRNFNQTINLLPSEIIIHKEDIIRFFRDDYMVARKTIISLRVKGTITLRNTIKYRKDIKYIKGYYGYIFIVSITPIWIILLKKKIVQHINRLN